MILVLALAVIPMADAHSLTVAEGMAGSPQVAGHSLGSALHGLLDVKKLSGDYKLIVILVEFTDIKHDTSRDAINDMIFTRMNQYWRELSYGQFNVIGDTVGSNNLGHNKHIW